MDRYARAPESRPLSQRDSRQRAPSPASCAGSPRRRKRYRMEWWILVAGAIVILAIALHDPSPRHLFTHFSPIDQNAGPQLKAPSAAHLMGTDNLGRDVWARVVYGSHDYPRRGHRGLPPFGPHRHSPRPHLGLRGQLGWTRSSRWSWTRSIPSPGSSSP